MGTDAKKQSERTSLDLVLQHCEMSGSDVQSHESPDFLLTHVDRRIGVEIARVFHDRDGALLRAQEALRRRVVTYASESYSCLRSPACLVTLFFSGAHLLRKERVRPLANEVVQLVGRHVPPMDGEWTADSRSLPAEIADVVIRRFRWCRDSEWIAPQSEWIPKLTKDILSKRIRAKEAKLGKYGAWDETWLVLVLEGTGLSSHFLGGDGLTATYQSEFSRVFVVDHFSATVTSLRIVPYS